MIKITQNINAWVGGVVRPLKEGMKIDKEELSAVELDTLVRGNYAKDLTATKVIGAPPGAPTGTSVKVVGLPSSDSEGMLTIKQAAQILGKGAGTIRKWIKEGALVGEKVNNKWMVKESDLEAVEDK